MGVVDPSESGPLRYAACKIMLLAKTPDIEGHTSTQVHVNYKFVRGGGGGGALGTGDPGVAGDEGWRRG